MSTSINKNGVWVADGSGINPNIAPGDFGSGWAKSSAAFDTYTEDGVTIAHSSREGLTGNSWLSMSYYVEDSDMVEAIKENGITASYDFKVDSYEDWDQKYTIRVFGYENNASLGSFYPAITNKTYHKYDTIEDGKWIRMIFTVSGDVLCAQVMDTDGKTIDDVNRFRIYFPHVRNGSVYFRKPKIELGSIATPWIPNTSDEIYVSDTQGFNEGYYTASVNTGSLNSNSFIEL